ncbi:lipopolysaccharide biosynthesis protein [Fibrella sp. HMF5335]|uniref:Lipopolysaccharide biosynthesis protein n=1 Tax=Fibrella rubiginis TaxID=2817060 RepID=A0A939GC02_9BACT|nr:lipopolysaccharide biosynthesis protein [Fibrella rubiginis]MBO0935566.1 lipopolysaccharide biosynthesis protein [Fibrella rubiginis]
MSISVFLRLLRQHLLWFALIPCLTAATAFYVTRNELKIYKSQTSLYTGLASGYSLMTDRMGAVMDRSVSAFDNLLSTLGSKETLLQVGVNLLADHLELAHPDSMVLGWNGFYDLQKAVPASFRAELPIYGDPKVLRRALDSLVRSPTPNPIKTLVLQENSIYSFRLLSEKIKGSARKNTNDVLLMEYEANDPAVAQQTLKYAIDVLNKRNSYFKTSETDSVVSYYEGRLKRAKEALDRAEGNLRAFNTNHNVLDYDEEARNMATSREALTNEYNQELMRKNAAKASLDALNKRMGQQSSIRSANTDLNEKQRKLAEAENQLSNARAYGQPKTVLTRLQAAVAAAQEDLKASAQDYDATTNASDALPQQTLAADRLAKSLEYEESSSKLELYQKRIGEYKAKTSEYEPLGSQLRQLERDLSVAEKEYFALLQQVDQSRTRQQDVAVGGKLDVLDAPDFPLEPQPSKRKQLVIVGIGVGIFLALLLMALRFWLDKRIQSPEQAEALIGRPITAFFPTVTNPLSTGRANRAATSMFEQLFNALNIEIAQVTAKPFPPVINLFSMQPKQGKSWVAHGLVRLYTAADHRVAYCYPRHTGSEVREFERNVSYLPYTVQPDFMNVTSIDYLLDHSYDFDAAQFDRIIVELPALANNQMPVYLLKNSALSLLIIDANSSWARAEKQLLSLYERVTQQPILTVLNRVGNNYIGDVGAAAPEPKQDSNGPRLQAQRTSR